MANQPVSTGAWKITGEERGSMGIYSSGNVVFTRANADLNEKNWRILSSSGLNLLVFDKKF